MYCYSFSDFYDPGRQMIGTPITATAIPTPNGVGVVMRLKSTPRKNYYVKCTRYAGDRLSGQGWQLSDFVNIQEEEPEIVTTFRDLKKDTAPFIACIKAVRVVTGYGLREAKDFVNAMVMLKATIEIVDFEPHLQS